MTDGPSGGKGSGAAGGDGAGEKQTPFQTHSAPIFVQNAEELIRLLASAPSPEAQVMQREAEELAERFNRWQVERPSNSARVAMIQALFELNRKARDHLAKSQKRSLSPTPETPGVQGFLSRLFKR